MNYRQTMTPRCQTCVRPTPEPISSGSVCGNPCGNVSENVCENSYSYPIAMAYVPVQTFQTTYDLNRSLEVGTIFPELHKPFCGKRCVR